jgi:hypothetical protein
MLVPAAEAKLNIGSRMREPGAVTAVHASCRCRRQVGVSKIVKSTRLAPKCGPRAAPLAGRPTQQHLRKFVVLLIAYYVAFMIAGDLAAYVIGLVTELEFGNHVSLIVFLALYFLSLWVAWLLAVWLTKPERAAPGSARSA